MLHNTEDLKEIVEAPRRGAKWLIEEIRYLCRVLISSADRFYWDDGFSRAASLAYSSLLSIVPFLMVVVGLLASFGSIAGYLPAFSEFIVRQFIPQTDATEQVLQWVTIFSEQASSLNIVVLPAIIVTSVLLINSIEYTLNKIWQVFEPRSIPHRIAIFCAIIVIGPVLAISAYYTTKVRVEPFILNYVEGVNFLGSFYNFILSFLIDVIAFLSLYFLIPKAPVRFNAAATGAFFAAILFDIAKSSFATYVRAYSSYDKIYGAFLTVPVFLFWLYLAWAIVLFGAEISYQAQHLPRIGKLWKKSPFSVGDGRLVLAFQSLILISRNFANGTQLPNDIELAEKLGCSTVVLKPALDALKKSGIIARGDSYNMPLSLTKNPSLITLKEIREALYKGRSSAHFAIEVSRMFAAYSEGNCDDKTLADLI